ncbi:MAG: hypothetical protein JWP35_798 [Caulobacter sp.]|nr:hypothetical protein [Caulobacter sp.]
MAIAFQVVLRAVLALGLGALSFLIARYGGAQPHGLETGEFFAVAAGVLAMAVWSWRQAPRAHGAAEFTANVIRHGLTIAGAAFAALLCLAAALLGAWMQHG